MSTATHVTPILHSTVEPVPDFLHLPTLGDHYSAATGSAVMTIIYQVSRQHAAQGGRSYVIVGEGTRQDYPVGQCINIPLRRLPTRREKAVDMIAARIGFRRRYTQRTYADAPAYVDSKFRGVVFIHNTPAAVPMFRSAHPSAQLCLWAHNRLFDTYGRRELRRVEAACDRIICVSEYLAGDLRRRLGGSDSGKICVVHNGVDIEQFRPAVRSGDHDEPPTILFIGRVTPVKGVDLLVRAAVELAKRGLSFRLRIIGNSGFSATDPLTPYERALREDARPLGRSAEFLPFTDRRHIGREYQRASIFCVPARWDEPFGLTTLEGMAAGLPTVAARRGGIPEAAGDAALYFDPPDAGQLADHLQALIASPDLRHAWGCRARRRAEAFSWDRQYDALTAAVTPASERILP